MLRDVNLNLKPSEMRIKLAKPGSTTIGIEIANIKHFSKPSLKLSLGRLNEVSFDVPYKIEKNHQLIDNPIIDRLHVKFLLRVQWSNVEEWFIINELNDNLDGSSEGVSVHAFSLGHELTHTFVTNLEETSVSPTEILDNALSETNWSAGTVDTKIIDKRRSFEVSETTVLDFITTIAETFGAIVIFDSLNRKINLVHPDNYKINRGFRISYGQYLKSMNRSSNSDDMATRLHVTGKDGLGINSINPTGAGYIESFAYFMYPFEAKVGTWKDIETKKWSEL